ncbi:MAG: hypothetical protein ACM3OO_01150 [Planctomycetaceae bacterium]
MRYRLTVRAVLVFALVGSTVGVAHAAPSSRRAAPPVQLSFYDGHQDAIVVTDSTNRDQARAMSINYAPGLARVKPRFFPKLFLVRGAAASGQLAVLGAETGEPSYSPIWRVIKVRWNQGVTPVLLTSDTQIGKARRAGDLTTTKTRALLNAPVIAESVTDPSTVTPPKVFMTFYDGHKDGMLATDVSTKKQATAKGINFAPSLGTLDRSTFPEIYIVKGNKASGQLQILGSEPGEHSYSPLWLETYERWRKGVTPTVIKSDTQVDELIGAGKLVETGTSIVLNCPVVSTP